MYACCMLDVCLLLASRPFERTKNAPAHLGLKIKTIRNLLFFSKVISGNARVELNSTHLPNLYLSEIDKAGLEYDMYPPCQKETSIESFYHARPLPPSLLYIHCKKKTDPKNHSYHNCSCFCNMFLYPGTGGFILNIFVLSTITIHTDIFLPGLRIHCCLQEKKPPYASK